MLRARVLMLIGICTFWSALHATEVPLTVHVPLTMGSFDMTSQRLIGMGEKKGDVFSAKEIKVLVLGLKSGMSLRDKHMHEKLEADKYPTVTVSDIKATGGKGTAKIKIRDVSKDIHFTYKDLGGGKATATFPLSLKDFKFTGISYNGVGVEDEVTVTATLNYANK